MGQTNGICTTFAGVRNRKRVFPPIKAMLPLGDEDSPAVFEARLHERMLETKAACLRKIRQKPVGSLKSAFFKWYLELVQDYFYYRDWERFTNDKNKAYPRAALTAIGRKFIERGLMTDEEDIFFLGTEEVLAIDDGKMTAKDVSIRVLSAPQRLRPIHAHRTAQVHPWLGDV